MTVNTIAVLGAGSWGTALASLLARNGHDTVLWGHHSAHIARLAKEHRNERYLPELLLPERLRYSSDIAECVSRASLILISVPSHAFQATLQQIQPHLPPTSRIAWASKGFDPEHGALLHQIVAETISPEIPVAVLSGPTFAREVAAELPTAMTVASPDQSFARAVAKLLHNPRFRVYTSDDLIGVEVGGAVKNVLAIATGAADGLGFGANTRSALVTRGLAEMIRLGLALGGKAETFMGLTGLGDLVLTCTDDQSRNRRLGLGLGRGENCATILARIGQEVEGVAAAREIHHLAEQYNIEMPISEEVYKVLYKRLSPRDAVQNLLNREQRAE